jgi:hypothetical protein
MSEVVLSDEVARKNSEFSRGLWWVLVAAWFVVVLVLGLNNFFVAPQGTAPIALLIASTTPVVAFLLLVSLSSSIQEFALAANLKFATAVQAWRIGGYVFLILYSYGYLPGYFAWPAGVGDIFIGVTAPYILSRLASPGFVRSKSFVIWNVLGILDLVVAVGMGRFGSLLIGNPDGPIPTTIMSQMPLVLVPTFFVPLFIMLHLVALLHARRAVQGIDQAAWQGVGVT